VTREEQAAYDALARIDRRAFLRLGGAAAAAGLLPVACGAGAPPPPIPLAVLTPRAYATFNAATRRIVGARGAALIERGEVDPAAAADDFAARNPAIAGALGSALAFLEWAPWPLVPKLRPFTSLDGPAQDRVLDALMRARIDVLRDVFKGVKSIAALCFYANPATRALTGFPGPFGTSAVPISAAMSGGER
jgi:hypothetical protein